MPKSPDVETTRLKGLRPSVFQTRHLSNTEIPRLEDAWRFAFQPEICNLWHFCKRSNIALVDKNPWLDDLKRRVQHYGYKYDYTARRIDASMHLGDLPRWLQDLGGRLVAAGIFAVAPDQVIVNEYLPGQGIAAHIDCQPCFEDTVVSLTTLSGCSMDFIDINSDAKQSVYLEPCSIVVLQDDARYLWRHGIAKSRKDIVDGRVRKRKRRVSLTFRKVKR